LVSIMGMRLDQVTCLVAPGKGGYRPRNRVGGTRVGMRAQ